MISIYINRYKVLSQTLGTFRKVALWWNQPAIICSASHVYFTRFHQDWWGTLFVYI